MSNACTEYRSMLPASKASCEQQALRKVMAFKSFAYYLLSDIGPKPATHAGFRFSSHQNLALPAQLCQAVKSVEITKGQYEPH